MTDTTTHLDDLIAAERKKANARIAKLRRAVAAEQRKVDEKVLELLRERQFEHYERLATEARRALVGAPSRSIKELASRTPTMRAHAQEGSTWVSVLPTEARNPDGSRVFVKAKSSASAEEARALYSPVTSSD